MLYDLNWMSVSQSQKELGTFRWNAPGAKDGANEDLGFQGPVAEATVSVHLLLVILTSVHFILGTDIVEAFMDVANSQNRGSIAQQSRGQTFWLPPRGS